MTRSNEKARPSVSARVISSSLIKQKQVRKCNRVFKKFLLEYRCFTLLRQFLLYSKLTQPYVHTDPLFFRFPSHLSPHSSLRRVPSAVHSRFSLK